VSQGEDSMAVRQLDDDPQTERSPVGRRCFIAAHPRTNLDTIRAILAERGIEATASYERPWIGARPIDTVMALIDGADLVIGVLDDPSSSTNLGFELGYAFARDKKIMVLLPQDSRTVPSDLAWTHHIRLNPTDSEGIAYNLDAILTGPMPNRQPHIPPAANTHGIGDAADEITERLTVALDEHDGVAFEQIVMDALRASGVAIVKSAGDPPNGHPGPSLGIWSDDLESSVGNPLLIELKMSISSRADLARLRPHVSSYLRARSVEWGLVVYADGPPWLESVPPVLFLRVAELLSRLRDEGFAEILSDLYGQAIRGA
jgi:nucleoside 2-deoxyribosyltransferase